ncbi:hypothetical protein [Botrimarina hoheduenensis]|uniref:PEP-CTERM protein-sorting domain-containing protein n=1 Tax=Botrimarina hoheduenensis TaxID=2528000 RepID=A0A5C5WCT0_9BACT|nr:hypothetical protein [Botrimarina hoheduenensis]TWT48474.1 hypothetical protein Pla111_02420 [Botrimarina hoheduenensis]
MSLSSLRNLYLRAICLFAIAVSLAPTACPALVIDDFSIGPFSATSYGSWLNLSQDYLYAYSSGDTSPLGFRRDMGVRGFLSNNQEGPAAHLGITFDTKVLDFQVEPQGWGYFNLEWSAAEGEVFNLLQSGLDEPNDRFRFRFLGAENAPAFSVLVYTMTEAGERRYAQSLQRSSALNPVDEILELPYSAFGGDVAWESVTSVTISAGRFRGEAGFMLDSISVEPPPKTGDYDRDGDVDLDDLDRWIDGAWSAAPGIAQPYTFNATRLSFDGNGDRLIDLADYTVWRDAYAPASPRSVPEPTGLGLAVGIGLLLAGPRRRE